MFQCVPRTSSRGTCTTCGASVSVSAASTASISGPGVCLVRASRKCGWAETVRTRLTSAFACGHAQLIASHCLATYRARPWDAQPPHIAWPSTVLVCDTAGTQPHGGAEGLRGVLGATPTLTAAHVALSRQSGAMPRRGVDHGVLDGDAARCGREFRAGATGGRRDCHDSWPARGAMPGYTSLALRR